MSRQKWLDDDGYKERLAQFMQEIKPKPDLKIIQQLKEKYKLARERHETDTDKN